jgi:hypothetical protein
MKLALNSISTLIQVFVSPDYDPQKKWEENAITELLKNDYIKKKDDVKYVVTEKGKCVVDCIANLPDPIWAMPTNMASK